VEVVGCGSATFGISDDVYRQYALEATPYAVILLVGITIMKEHHWFILKHEHKPCGWRVARNVLHGLFVVATILATGYLLESLI
jgi:hypothetical protein